ncbi:nonstructural protein [Microviridae sp.]|nr:nonstructural protein [Microviridae sp.]
MKFQIYSVYDSKAESHLLPYHTINQALAVRHFQDACSDPDHSFHKHPEDYSLFHLGSYDDVSAKFDNLKAPLHIADARQFTNGVLIDA